MIKTSHCHCGVYRACQKNLNFIDFLEFHLKILLLDFEWSYECIGFNMFFMSVCVYNN